MDSLRSQNPFWLVLLTVGLLSLISLLQPGLRVGGVALRPVRLLADVRAPVPRAPARVRPAPRTGAASAPQASAATAEAPPPEALAAAPPAPKVANSGQLTSFVAALREAKATGRKVRIAYFGDSMIEGDLITGDLRNSLQAEFGGTGVGYVPIKSVAADFRATIRAMASDNWQEYNLVSPDLPGPYRLGVAGYVFGPCVVPPADSTAGGGGSWANFQGGSPFARVRRFEQARLLYGPGPGTDYVLATAAGRTSRYALAGTQAANELVLRPGGAVRQLRLDFATRAPRPVYGVSFEGAQGVTLDNFSFRGSSGLSLLRIPFPQLAAFGPLLDYRLIILHYGVNIADAHYQSYKFYERAMTRVVDRLQRAFPNASILVVGMGDKSSRIDGEFVTDPSVPRLLAAQQRIAQRNHAAFWNLFEAMGGENAMVAWVNASPPLANKDYTHVNARGARRVAQFLYTYLMGEYQRAAPAEPLSSPPAPVPAPGAPAAAPAPAAP